VQIALQVTCGKLTTTSHEAACEVDALQPSRLFIFDRNSNTEYLIDTGSDISVLPINAFPHLKPSSTANGTQINTYGMRTMTLTLGLRRRFSWTFVGFTDARNGNMPTEQQQLGIAITYGEE